MFDKQFQVERINQFGYSLGGFAKALGVSHSQLGQLLDHPGRIRMQTAQKWAILLDLPPVTAYNQFLAGGKPDDEK